MIKILDLLDECLTIEPENLRTILSKFPLSRENIEEHIKFDTDSYTHNIVKTGTCYQALILCWKAGQHSPIHDHAKSVCGILVVDGIATEDRYDNNLVLESTSEFEKGKVIVSEGKDIHCISNRTNDELITLHIYSPPLFNMRIFEEGK